jgi:multimeric flavodoxin WrbA
MPEKKILVVMASPRKSSNSSILARQIGAGAEGSGASVEYVSLRELDIRPCAGCDACRKEPRCIVGDDMQSLYPKLQACDALVLASPVYWFTVAAQMKAFVDRWYAFGGDRAYAALAGKRVGIVLTYGDADPFISGAVNALRAFQDCFRYVGGHVVGAVYGTANKEGEVTHNQALMEKATRLGKALTSAD